MELIKLQCLRPEPEGSLLTLPSILTNLTKNFPNGNTLAYYVTSPVTKGKKVLFQLRPAANFFLPSVLTVEHEGEHFLSLDRWRERRQSLRGVSSGLKHLYFLKTDKE